MHLNRFFDVLIMEEFKFAVPDMMIIRHSNDSRTYEQVSVTYNPNRASREANYSLPETSENPVPAQNQVY